MQRAAAIAIAVCLAGCSAATTEPAPVAPTSSASPAEVTIPPTARRSPKPCGGPHGGPKGGSLAAGEIGSGPGYDRFAPPSGFQSEPLSNIENAGENESTVLHFFSLEPSKDRVAVWTLFKDDDAPALAVIDLHRHPAGTIPKGELERIVVERFSGLEMGASDEDRAWRHLFNFFVAWTDSRGREAVEWAYVMKGCERQEVYERFIRDGNVIWQVSVLLEPSVEDATLGAWLAAAFDEPMAMPIPEGRKNLLGEGTPR
jgi:hypothetical protein